MNKFITSIFVYFAIAPTCYSQDTCITARYVGYIAIEEPKNNFMLDDMVFRGPYLYFFQHGNLEYKKSVALIYSLDIARFNTACYFLPKGNFIESFYDSLGYNNPLEMFRNMEADLPVSLTVSRRRGHSFLLYYIDMDVIYIGKAKHIFLRKSKSYSRNRATYLVANIRSLEAVSELPVK